MKVRLKNAQPNQQIKTRSSSQATGATFVDHVIELRRRALWVGLVFIIFSALAYNYNEILLKIIMAPLHGEKLIYLTPGGGFSFIFLVTIYAGLLVTIPVFVYHLHAFIKPALPTRARHSAAKIIMAATLLIIGGVSYGYFVAIPAALEFLTTFAGDAVTPNLTADSYLNFFLAYVAGLAFLSLLPLILMFVHWINPLKPGGLLKSERWVFLFAFVAAALITPTPDIVNQVMIALPVIGIYQLGVIAVIVASFKEKRIKRSLLAKQQREEERKLRHAPAIPVTVHSGFKPTAPVLSVSQAASLPQNPAHKPVRVMRSVDGFRSPQRDKMAPRTIVPPRKHALAYPARASLDGMMVRRTQISQN